MYRWAELSPKPPSSPYPQHMAKASVGPVFFPPGRGGESSRRQGYGGESSPLATGEVGHLTGVPPRAGRTLNPFGGL